jgi:hypothetical protein
MNKYNQMAVFIFIAPPDFLFNVYAACLKFMLKNGGKTMDPVVQLALVLIGLTVIFRIRHTIRKSRMGKNKGERINTKLEELRKKRDEE